MKPDLTECVSNLFYDIRIYFSEFCLSLIPSKFFKFQCSINIYEQKTYDCTFWLREVRLWNTIWAQVTIASVDLNQRRFWRRLQQPFIEYSEQKYNVYIELVAKPSERTLQQKTYRLSSQINCPLICLKEAYSAVRKLQVNLDYFVKPWKIFLFISKTRTAKLVDRNHGGKTCSCFHKALSVIIVSPCKKSTRTFVLVFYRSSNFHRQHIYFEVKQSWSANKLRKTEKMSWKIFID